MKIIKINLWNQGMHGQILKGNAGRNCPEIVLPPSEKSNDRSKSSKSKFDKNIRMNFNDYYIIHVVMYS